MSIKKFLDISTKYPTNQLKSAFLSTDINFFPVFAEKSTDFHIHGTHGQLNIL